jgi:NAD-dependent deacetylase
VDSLQRTADLIRSARTLTVITGAGVSAASGIPTFRGADGRLRADGASASLWKKVRAETLATPEAFENDPKLVWEWYDWRRGMIRGAEPNAAHHVLAKWSRDKSGCTLITQNVDGLHERAGARDLLRLHGSIWHVRCWNGCDAGRRDWLDETVPLPTLPPRCPYCGGLVRPGVVWFGESLDPDTLARAEEATTCDVFLTVGTSSVVYPAAGLVHRARARGATTIEINTDATDATSLVSIALRGKAEEILGLLDRDLMD